MILQKDFFWATTCVFLNNVSKFATRTSFHLPRSNFRGSFVTNESVDFLENFAYLVLKYCARVDDWLCWL